MVKKYREQGIVSVGLLFLTHQSLVKESKF
jgi:hypothetical protein